MSSSAKNILLAIVCSTAVMVVLVAGYNIISNPAIKRVCEMFGYTKEELVGKEIDMLELHITIVPSLFATSSPSPADSNSIW